MRHHSATVAPPSMPATAAPTPTSVTSAADLPVAELAHLQAMPPIAFAASSPGSGMVRRPAADAMKLVALKPIDRSVTSR